MQSRPPILPPLLLGFALGGFFDGILLHQILQWHHLLSLVPGSGDLGRQLLWDGLFHAAMYGIGLAGLWGLWRHRDALSQRPLLPGVLTGFALWHIVDAILVHWLLGLHRIRLDVPDPLAWDLLWLLLFGVLPLLAARLLARVRRTPRGALPLAALAALVMGSGTIALQPQRQAAGAPDAMLVALADRGASARLFDALARGDGRLLWIDDDNGLALVTLPRGPASLLVHGLLPLSGGQVPASCASYSMFVPGSPGPRPG